MSRLFGQITPTLPARLSNASASLRKRSAVTRMSPPSGSGVSTASLTKPSSAIFPPLTSGIDALLERFDTEALHRVDEQLLRPLAQHQISFHDVLDDVGNLVELDAGADQIAKRGALIGTAADGDLVDLLAILPDAENADMADMMMAAGIDAAGDVDVQPADQIGELVVGEASRQLLCDRDRARICQRAIIEPRTGDDVRDQIDVRRGEPELVERLPQRRQVTLGDMRQRQVLLMAHADLAEGIFVGEIGERIHLLGGGITRRRADRLQRDRDDGVALVLVRGHRILAPRLEVGIGRGLPQFVRHVRQLLIGRIDEARADVLDHLVVDLKRGVADMLPLLLDLAGELLDAELVHQDLDARLVDIVATSVLIVDAQDGLDIAQEIAAMNEVLDGLADEWRTAETAADQNLEAGFALLVLGQTQANIMNLDRGTVVVRRGDRDLELARQEREFRMQRGVLADQLRPDARILDLTGRDAGPLVRSDVAHVVAGGLHRMDADLGEICECVRQFGELDPVELDVLARGEMTVAAVIFARDMGKLPQLVRRQRSVGNRDAEHVGVQLQIDAVLQAQHLEFVLGQLARETALHLVAEFRDALVDQRAIDFIVSVHD